MRRALAATAVVAAGLAASGCRKPIVRTAGAAPFVVFMSDFGTADDGVAICKGVMLEIEPGLRIVDLTHQVPPFSIQDGARFLAGTAPHYPKGTVFLVVVDPGVGSTRKAIAARTRGGQIFVLPDNGLLTLVHALDPVEEVREIQNPKLVRASARSSTFHGRDIFAPVAAHLARGRLFDEVGARLDDWVHLEVAPARRTSEGIAGEVVGLDGPYGNLVTNVGAELFAQLGHKIGDTIEVRIGEERILVPYVHTFSDVPRGAPLLYVDSRGRIALAVNLGHFARQHHVQPPQPFLVRGSGR